MDSSPPSPTVKPTLRCSSISSQNRSKVFKTTSLNTRKPLNEPLRVTPSTTDTFPTSASHAATDSPVWLSGSNSTMTVQHRASQTLTALNRCHTLPTYISKNQHFLFHLIQSYYILFLLFWG